MQDTQKRIISLDRRIGAWLSLYKSTENVYERSWKLSEADHLATELAVATGWWDDEKKTNRARGGDCKGKDREKFNAYYRKYRIEHKERINEIKRNSRKKIYRSDALQRWKDRANRLINKLLKRGKMKRGLCEVCGKEAQAHHDSYLKDNLLNVRFLCIFHHSEWHRLNEPELPKL